MRQKYRFQILTPPKVPHARVPSRTRVDEQLYGHYLSAAQRLRARVYLKDGAIQPWQIDAEDRFHMFGDERSWHFLLVEDDEVVGCAKYLVHPNSVPYENLRIAHSALAKDPQWRDKVRRAVEAELRHASENNFSFVEIGGWALAEHWRGTAAALEILVASYALAHMWGGSIGACSATVRHNSSSILRRIGGSSLHVDGEPLPTYEDSQYGCQMELLRFDSRSPSERFLPLIHQLKARVKNSIAISRSAAPAWEIIGGEIAPERLSLLNMAPYYC